MSKPPQARFVEACEAGDVGTFRILLADPSVQPAATNSYVLRATIEAKIRARRNRDEAAVRRFDTILEALLRDGRARLDDVVDTYVQMRHAQLSDELGSAWLASLWMMFDKVNLISFKT